MTLHPFHRRPLLLLTAVLLAGCTKPPPPADEPPAAPVKWEAPSRVALEEWTELVGATQPLPGCVAHVTAAIDGQVTSLLEVKDADGKVVKTLHEGDEVAQNDEIAHLNDLIPRLNREKAGSAVKTAAAETAQAQIALNLATDKLNRLKDLKTTNPKVVPDIDLITAGGAEEDARSKLLVAQQKEDQTKKDVEALTAQLKLYTLKAPIKGQLGRIQAALGQTLAVGAEVAEVVNLEDEIDVLCFVPQSAAARLEVDQPAGLGGLDERPGEARTPDASGHVAFVSDKAEPETGCFAVKVRFSNKKLHLRGNTVQRVRVVTKAGEEQLALSEDALIEDQESPSVVIVEDVKTGKNDEGKEVQTGKAKRMQAVIGVRDRVLKQVGLLGLVDADGKKWTGDLEQVLFVTQKAPGLQTGDDVRLEEGDAD